MSRQHSVPILISPDGKDIHPAGVLGMGVEGHGIDERTIQTIVERFPDALPIAEIDPAFVNPISICTELNTPVGAIDNFLLTETGMPVLVECKLWRNPEGRRKVVGQILDYAKELSAWTYSDLQREVNKRVNQKGDPILGLLREAGKDVNEIDLSDAVSFNLRKGRFLLLVVGDGIREGVEAIAEHLQSKAGMQFTFGLVEMPIYTGRDGHKLVVPRVLARTEMILRHVVAMPDGFVVEESEVANDGNDAARVETPERKAGRERRNAIRKAFWTDFLDGFALDDPAQDFPPASLGGHIVFKFGAPGGSSWLTVYRDMRGNKVGLSLSGNANSIGERAHQSLRYFEEDLKKELGPSAIVDFEPEKPVVADEFEVNDLESQADREAAIAWLRERVNVFVNALRPRIRRALRDLGD